MCNFNAKLCKAMLNWFWPATMFHFVQWICKIIIRLKNSTNFLIYRSLRFSLSGQMFLMNRFFDGEFMTFGLDVIAHMEADQEDRMDPMIYIFPRMTKCTFYKYGVSGEVSFIRQKHFYFLETNLRLMNNISFHFFFVSMKVERHDAICILPLNVVNEKIYIFLWFWFILLFILTSLTLIYRVVIIFSPRMRVYLLRLRFR